MESLIVSPLLQTVFDQLASPVLEQVRTRREFKKEIEKLQEELQLIQAVIQDAEEQQTKDKKVKFWLEKLKDVAYDADDLLDEISSQVLRRRSMIRDLKHYQLTRDSLVLKMIEKILQRTKKEVKLTCLNLELVKNYYFIMPHRLKAIRERLHDIAREMSTFQLKETVVYTRTDTITRERRETGPYVDKSQVYGRKEDEEKVIEMLLKSNNCKDSVFTLVGIGGIGKTTLAQLAYRNDKVTSHFDLKMWISVYDNFNPRKIMAEILNYIYVTKQGTGDSSLPMGLLQTQLMEALCGKKVLLVLDDVWSDDPDEWDKVKIILGAAADGSKVIVTTRSQKVASMMSTNPPYNLKALSKDDCWTLFKQRAFADGEEDAFPYLLPIGKQIVDKCKGVPLAAKVLGHLLCSKREESEWSRVQESDLWNLDGGDNRILSVQKLSYNHLPSHLKQCFAYCAVFPKYYAIVKEKLIHQWIAAGLVQFPTCGTSDSPQLTLEDIANDYFNDLLGMSFLEASTGDESNTIEFRMHDLIHDLAKSVAGKEFLTAGHANYQRGILSKHPSIPVAHDSLVKIRHALVECKFNSNTVHEALHEAKKLHTLHLLSLGDVCEGAITNSISSFRYLRTLNLSGFGIKKLHKSIGDLICLRYLDLSNTAIEDLPAMICHLIRLQSLDLSGCNSLQELPKRMTNMVGLRHLNIKDCVMLAELPAFIGRLSNLQTLPIFIVGQTSGQSTRELGQLSNLRGELKIKSLENEFFPTNSLLFEFKQLHSLGLAWGDVDQGKLNHQARRYIRRGDRLDPKRVIESLEPNCFIRKLFINGYEGAGFPKWMNEDKLRNLTHLELINCPNCESLPVLGQLPALEVLHIQGMDSVACIGKDVFGCGTRSFSSLNELSVRDFPNLKTWESMDSMAAFACLHKLTIINCPRWINMPQFPALQHLEMRECNSLMVRSAAELQSLSTLVIDNFPELLFIPKALPRTVSPLLSLSVCSCPKLHSMPANFGEFRALKSLRIGWCEELECLPPGLTNLTSLETLEIIQCPKLVSLLGERIQGLRSLRILSIENCDGFSSLPIDMQHSTALERLTIMYCSNLASLPDDLQYLSVLKSLTILSCAELACLPQGLQFVTTLQNLEIHSCEKLMELPEWIGNLISLRSLAISDCKNIKCLPERIQGLHAIQHLSIRDCPELEERCKRDNGVDWEKISHVPYLYIGFSSTADRA